MFSDGSICLSEWLTIDCLRDFFASCHLNLWETWTHSDPLQNSTHLPPHLFTEIFDTTANSNTHSNSSTVNLITAKDYRKHLHHRSIIWTCCHFRIAMFFHAPCRNATLKDDEEKCSAAGDSRTSGVNLPQFRDGFETFSPTSSLIIPYPLCAFAVRVAVIINGSEYHRYARATDGYFRTRW